CPTTGVTRDRGKSCGSRGISSGRDDPAPCTKTKTRPKCTQARRGPRSRRAEIPKQPRTATATPRCLYKTFPPLSRPKGTSRTGPKISSTPRPRTAATESAARESSARGRSARGSAVPRCSAARLNAARGRAVRERAARLIAARLAVPGLLHPRRGPRPWSAPRQRPRALTARAIAHNPATMGTASGIVPQRRFVNDGSGGGVDEESRIVLDCFGILI
ncbi:hypothetical protein B0T24DRAFT_709812, partial [Lasiosphaeria ovina]